MSAFNYPTNNQPVPGSPAFKAANILQIGSQTLANLTQRRISAYKLFWSDPINVAAALGTSATEVFASDAALVAFLGPQLTAAGASSDVIAQATAGVPDGYTVTINADGSVTITKA